jgi:transcription factor IIIB subunit 2
MNNFRRSVEEIVQVVKIADTTLKKRLEEFKATPSGSLTLADFRNVWLEDEMDPPAFTRGKEKEEAEKRALEGDEDGEGRKEKGKGKARSKKSAKKRKGKRKKGEDTDDDPGSEQHDTGSTGVLPSKQPLNPAVLSDSILAGSIDPTSLSHTAFVDDNSNIDPVLLQASIPSLSMLPPVDYVEEQVSQVLAEEVTDFLNNSQGAEITDALDEAEQRRLAQIAVVDDLTGLNEEELDRFLLSEDEVKIKERVWVELNREYLEALAGKTFPFHC